VTIFTRDVFHTTNLPQSSYLYYDLSSPVFCSVIAIFPIFHHFSDTPLTIYLLAVTTMTPFPIPSIPNIKANISFLQRQILMLTFLTKAYRQVTGIVPVDK